MDPDPLRSPASTGWFPDPLRRFEFRYFNGQRWTADVSADGTRFVDPGPFTPPANQPRSPHVIDRHPARTIAVMSLVLGIAGVALSWAPFIFVLGGIGSIAAVVLGVIALRRTARVAAAGAPVTDTPSGRGFAIAALCLGPLGIGLCVVGVILTGIAYREFSRYTDPGPHRIEDTACTFDGRRATFSGTIVNLDDDARDYELLVQFLDGSTVTSTDRISVDDVVAGQSKKWSTSARVGEIDLDCRVFNVTGPYPFGLDNG